MNADLSCEWMKLKLRSPLVVASLTPMSNARIKEHVEFFESTISQGAGAVILPSINSERHGSPDKNEEKVEAYIIDAGLSKNDHMAFSVLGPTVPNIVSVEYGLCLASAVIMKSRNTPVIASVSNLGSSEQILAVIQQLDGLGVDGIELNFSCPNVDTREGDVRDSIPDLIARIRAVTKRPLSLKLTPYQDYSAILNNINGNIDGLTLSNAYLGLTPPRIENGRFSPYDTADFWAPGGIYGPFERPLTYYKLFQMQKVAYEMGVDIACAGGIVSGNDAIQAILLGAAAVEISSGIQWHSTAIFRSMNDRIQKYLEANGHERISEIRGSALTRIRGSADEVLPMMRRRKSLVNAEKCLGCKDCACTDRLCFAISKGDDNKVVIDSELCSGCGWCVKVCRFGAIRFVP